MNSNNRATITLALIALSCSSPVPSAEPHGSSSGVNPPDVTPPQPAQGTGSRIVTRSATVDCFASSETRITSTVGNVTSTSVITGFNAVLQAPELTPENLVSVSAWYAPLVIDPSNATVQYASTTTLPEALTSAQVGFTTDRKTLIAWCGAETVSDVSGPTSSRIANTVVFHYAYVE